jgi:hypothetical protein
VMTAKRTVVPGRAALTGLGGVAGRDCPGCLAGKRVAQSTGSYVRR